MRIKNLSLSFGSQIFKALADESRIRILYLLDQEKMLCISDIELILDFTQTKTSRHLIYLKNAGLVNSKKIDQWAFYYIKEEVYELLSTFFSYFKKDQQLLTDSEILQNLRSNRELAKSKISDKKLLTYS